MATAFEEGDPINQIILLLLIVLALRILASRHLDWPEIFAHNSALTLLLVALASVTWCDFSFISFKRWIRDLGTYVMVLVVLSESHPLTAISFLFDGCHTCCLILSIVLIKYYPDMGVVYNPWTGSPQYVGAATSKKYAGAHMSDQSSLLLGHSRALV